ncbi:MAG TPA: His-Xaa-Ser system radical SAM maturase HxsB [Paludibacteraceae bacterium]|jgi:His-Xaa-Ser system radical SAM maturase HxsB|nr:His-Xaa-Ser system radical SAM maturase HxsB [Paludibacteraceae bacterium]
MENYQILPFRFKRFNENEYFLSNDVGEFEFLENKDFKNFVSEKLDTDCDVFQNLKSKQFLTDAKNLESVTNMLATKFRTKKSILNDFTSLHMVVPTLRCNSDCIYCQVSKKDLTDKGFDMSKQTAKKIVKTIFESPSPVIKIEFQGGEPLTDFEMVQYIMEEAEWQNLFKKKHLEFVICTNLSLITPEMLKYLKKHKCYISTSLDGAKDLHNTNRPLQDTKQTHELFEEKLKLTRGYLGEDSVSALMTTTCYSLGHFKEIVDEYVRLGFNSVFFRSLNPYGFAKRDKHKIAYAISDFIENYKEGLMYIIDLNLKGTYFVEGYAELLLKRILTPFATGFVDLQSPAGVGIAGAIYDYNGNVYVSDEARMMASVNNQYFKMGNVNENTYQEMFNGDFLRNIIANSCTECLSTCAECAYQPFCGADPVRNFSEQGDIVGHRPTSEMCRKTKEIITFLLELIKKNDSKINQVFWSWITKQSISNISEQ